MKLLAAYKIPPHLRTMDWVSSIRCNIADLQSRLVAGELTLDCADLVEKHLNAAGIIVHKPTTADLAAHLKDGGSYSELCDQVLTRAGLLRATSEEAAGWGDVVVIENRGDPRFDAALGVVVDGAAWFVSEFSLTSLPSSALAGGQE